MIDNPFREHLPRFTAPLLALYERWGLTPNMITGLALGFACLASLAVAQGWAVVAIGLWWLGRLLDGTDGIYARATNQTSPFGAYLDILGDMASYSIMILGFANLYPEWSGAWQLVLLLYVLCIASALALGSLEQQLDLNPRDNRGLRLGAGLAEGGETGIAYTLFLLWPAAIGWLVTAWIGILAATIVMRTMLAQRVLIASKPSRY